MAQRRSADDPTDLLVRTSFTVMALLTRVAAQHEMSLTQLRVFGILRDRRPRMSELADFLGLERSTMSGLIDRGERRGIVQRVPSADDDRAIEIVMTPAGHELAERVHAEVRDGLAPLIDHLDTNGLTSLVDVLSRLVGPTPSSAVRR